MAYQFIEPRRIGGVLIVTLDDPPTRNAIGAEMAAELRQELDRLEADPDLRVLVLTGRDPSFCSGANVRRMGQALDQEAAPPPLAHQRPWQGLDEAWSSHPAAGPAEGLGVRAVPLWLHNLQKPSIAAINGHAIGLGMGLALSCDIRLASEEARMAEAFIRNGLIPADGSCWQLPRMIGIGNTLLLQYTGEAVGADEALRLGLVNRVLPHQELMGAALELAQKLAQGPTYTMGLIKRLVHRSLEVDFEASLWLAGPAQELARHTEDHREGVRAFIEKRRPVFKGR